MGDTPGGALADSIGRLRRALRRASRIADPDRPLSFAQLELLTCLAEHPYSRPGRLARILHLRANSVTTLVNSLAEQGMLVRDPADDDRRAVTLRITAAGQLQVQARQAITSRVLDRALSTLPAGDRAVLAQAIPALAALSAAIEDASGATVH